MKAAAVTSDHCSPLHPRRGPDGGTVPARTVRGRLRALWHTVVGAAGLIMGLLPHVLHHIGLLAGTAPVAGSGGTALFEALLASIPMLVRLYRRFGRWTAPALGLLAFAATFSRLRLSSAGPSAARERT